MSNGGFPLRYSHCTYRLNPNDTVHKGTSKLHKMDGKITHFGVHVYPSIFGFLIIPLHPAPIQKCRELLTFILSPKLKENAHHFFSAFFLVWFQPKKCLSLCRDLTFCFILVHTQIIQVWNSYIIIYTMKKHHFTWTYILNWLIEIYHF